MLVANVLPNKITITNKAEKTHTQLIDSWLNRYHKDPAYKKDGTRYSNLEKKKSTLQLSANSVRSLRNSVNSLVFLSEPKTVYSPSKKAIYNFRASFITLTLPSSQTTSDVKVKKCLDLFLIDLRRVYNVKNYVWRSELQKNGNIHFHLVIDRYIYHKVIRNYWLKALRHTDYVKRYQSRFEKMSFIEYKKLRTNPRSLARYGPEKLHQKIVAAYAYGKRTKWLSPNCTDIKNVFNVNQMSAYVSKYMAKDGKKDKAGNVIKPTFQPTAARIESFGKVWGRSTSLSRLKFIFPIVYTDFKPFIDKLISANAVLTKVYDYCTTYYFNFKAMPQELNARINSIIFGVAKTWSYPFNSV